MTDAKVLKKLQDEVRNPKSFDELSKSNLFHPSTFTTIQFIGYSSLLHSNPELTSRKAEIMV